MKQKQIGIQSRFLFIDSGAHSLYETYCRPYKHVVGYGFYDSKEFWAYVDAYAEFIKRLKPSVFANVDPIFNPELTYKVQKYLETKHGLRPIPVVHYGADVKWLEKYLADGHEYIALGGLGQEVTREMYVAWADRMFDRLCDNKDRLPVCKVHGFAITSFALMSRYPWYSVDSTSWLLHASRGTLLVPKRKDKDGNWIFDDDPDLVSVAMRNRNPRNHYRGTHRFKPSLRARVLEYIESMGFEFGESKTEYDAKTNTMHEEIVRKGVSNDHYLRGSLNALYYIRFAEGLRWPRPFPRKRRMPEKLKII